MLKIPQYKEIKEIIQSYTFSGEHIYTNEDLSFWIEKENERDVAVFTDFFMNKEFIGIEDNSKEAGYRNIEFKMQRELNREVFENNNLRAHLVHGQMEETNGYFLMIADKEWNLTYNEGLGKIYEKYPELYKKHYCKYANDVNTSQFWKSYLEEANPLFINPYTANIIRYNDTQIKQKYQPEHTAFSNYQFIKKIDIVPDLKMDLYKGMSHNIPIHYDKKLNQTILLAVDSSMELPIIKINKRGTIQSGIHGAELGDVGKKILTKWYNIMKTAADIAYYLKNKEKELAENPF